MLTMKQLATALNGVTLEIRPINVSLWYSFRIFIQLSTGSIWSLVTVMIARVFMPSQNSTK